MKSLHPLFLSNTDDAYVHDTVKVTILGDINRDDSMEPTDLIILECSWDTDVEDPCNELLNTTVIIAATSTPT